MVEIIKKEEEEKKEEKSPCCEKQKHFDFFPDPEVLPEDMVAFLEQKFPICKGNRAKQIEYSKAGDYVDGVFGLILPPPRKDITCPTELNIIADMAQMFSTMDPSASFGMALVLSKVREHIQEYNPELFASYCWEHLQSRD